MDNFDLMFQATSDVYDANTIQSCLDATIGWKPCINTAGARKNRKTTAH